MLPNGRDVVRFVLLEAEETPAAMAELCQRFGEAWDAEQVDRLLVLHAFTLDFSCTHPFADGNGRLARLSTLLLYEAGCEAGRYISLGVVGYAYREFEGRVGEMMAAPGVKSEAVQAAIAAFASGYLFTISELERLCPAVSRATIRRVLDELREKGQVECLGTGRWAQWRKI